MKYEPEGTYLLRFSKTPGILVLTFVKDDAVKHARIRCDQPNGLFLADPLKLPVLETKFTDIVQLIQSFSPLKTPLSCSFPKFGSFQGIMTSEESEELLSAQLPGTFMVRMTATGNYVISVLKKDSKIEHFFIQKKSSEEFVISLEHDIEKKFKSIEQVLDYYNQQQVLRNPIKTLSPIFVEDKPTEESMYQ